MLKYIENNKTQKIDLIITDITMPKLDGISLNKAIKQKNQQLKHLL
ncbi:response regulator [Tenacibaculum finnmarkense]|nr:response regulator [Tenacibaculum finnmarkense]